MARFELLSIANLRSDGRKPSELRGTKIQMGVVSSSMGSTVSGSCRLQQGLTSVLACVHGPSDCTRREEELPGRALVTVHCSAAPFASDIARSDRKLQEESRSIQAAMEASILRHLYPRSKIHVEIFVLSDDGSRLSAAINATTCALMDAGVAMKDLICSCSAGLAEDSVRDGVSLVDLNNEEIMSSSTDKAGVHLLAAIMPQRGTVVLAQCKSRLSLETYESVLGAAIDGCHQMFSIMTNAVREKAALLLAARRGKSLAITKANDMLSGDS